MLTRVTDKVRLLVNDALASEAGNQWKPVKLLREALGTANDLVGRPFCSAASWPSGAARGTAARRRTRSAKRRR